jgi:acyl-CoA thioester hydrolase
MSDLAAPFDAYRDVVRPEWIDHNQHMNMGYYLVVFDFATDETHLTYHREVRAADPLRFTTQLLAYDPKRIHYFHAMYHATEGYLAATNELMSLHVSLATRRASPMAPPVLSRLAAIQNAHDPLTRPVQVGRTIGLANRPRRD